MIFARKSFLVLAGLGLLTIPVKQVYAEPAPNVPQHKVNGTDIAFFHKPLADEANKYMEDVRLAIKNCDKDAFHKASNKFHYVYQKALRRSSGGISVIAENATFGMMVDRENHDEGAAASLDGLVPQMWQDAQPCGPSRELINAVSIFVGGGAAGALGSGHTGTSDGATDITNKLKSDDRGTVLKTGVKVETKIGNGNQSGGFWDGLFDVFASLSRTTTKFDGDFSNTGTGGDAFLIPGTGDPMAASPNGFSLAFAGGLNTLTSGTLDIDHRETEVSIGAGKPIVVNGNTVVTPFAGLGYTRLDSTETFTGSIAGYATNFTYNTTVENDVISPFIGVKATHRPEWAENIAQGFPVEFFGNAMLALDFNNADGRDNLEVSGGATDSQSVKISEDDTTPRLGFGGGVIFNPDGVFSISLGAEFERQENLPVVKRAGGGARSALDFDGTNSVTGTIRGTLKF